MGDFEIKVNPGSLQRLRENLETLKKAAEKKIATKAMYHAASLVSEKVRSEIKSEDLILTGNLLRSIGVAGLKLPTGRVGVKVGLLQLGNEDVVKIKRGDLGYEGIDRSAFYGRFLELGTKYIYARHFMQKAGAGSADAFVDAFTTKAGELFEIEAAKLPKS